MAVWMKACPHCGGDLLDSWNEEGQRIVSCLLCTREVHGESLYRICKIDERAVPLRFVRWGARLKGA